MRIIYGSVPTSYGELLLPDGPGPFPVAMLLHGGCWLATLGAMEDFRPMAERLTGDGIATWNIEYRRVGHDGGGWPGTFLDLGRALDYLGDIAEDYPLDLKRIVALGHSSGGHFAAWLAVRGLLPGASEIKGAAKAALAGVVIADAFIDPLVVESRSVDGELFCGEKILERLIGGDPNIYPDRLREISPLQWLPWRIPQYYVVSSRRYPVVPARPLADGRTTMAMPDYPELARLSGDQIGVEIIPEAGHFEFVEAPESDAFLAARRALLKLIAAVTAQK
jgi:acetyl esterase/lipase